MSSVAARRQAEGAPESATGITAVDAALAKVEQAAASLGGPAAAESQFLFARGLLQLTDVRAEVRRAAEAIERQNALRLEAAALLDEGYAAGYAARVAEESAESAAAGDRRRGLRVV